MFLSVAVVHRMYEVRSVEEDQPWSLENGFMFFLPARLNSAFISGAQVYRISASTAGRACGAGGGYSPRGGGRGACRVSGVPDEEPSDAESLPSRGRSSSQRSPRASAGAGLTRAIARTQQSERVRAHVNRHRITQARTAQVWHEECGFSSWLPLLSPQRNPAAWRG